MATGQSDKQTPNLFASSRSQEVFKISREFEFKVSYDFKRLVFLVPNGINIILDSMLENVFRTTGYEAHKIIYHVEMPSHIHVRYASEENADQAINELRNVKGLKALKVSELLASMYTIEHIRRRFPAWTLTIVDIEGMAQHTNPLSKEVVGSLLRKFGEPRIFTYNMGQSTVNHVQALFSSMAEALGASIANGSWFQGEMLESPRFRYRVRLVGSDKEREILTFSSNPSHALELDYFIGSDLNDIPTPSDHAVGIPPDFYPPGNGYNPGTGYRNTQREYSRSRSYFDKNSQGQNRHRQPNYRQNRTYARSKGGHAQNQLVVPQEQVKENPAMSVDTPN